MKQTEQTADPAAAETRAYLKAAEALGLADNTNETL